MSLADHGGAACTPIPTHTGRRNLRRGAVDYTLPQTHLAALTSVRGHRKDATS